MSINKKRFSAAAIIFTEILIGAFFTKAQTFEAKITVFSASKVRIEGKLTDNKTNQPIVNWSFQNSAIGAENLGGRISDFNLKDRNGNRISVRKLAVGEYLASAEADSFQYDINLNPSPNIKSRAHTSWLEAEQGILMTDDLLPQFDAKNKLTSARIQMELPADWQIFTSEEKADGNLFNVNNIEKAIFAVGKNWHGQNIANLDLIISGEWQFSDSEAGKLASEIFEEYRKLFGEIPFGRTQIILVRFPKDVKFGRWEAETRGTTLTVFSSDMPFKASSLQRLHEQLRHEIFHLWIPNNLALTGNYDWFYEGFTVYKALKTGVSMNQIRFEDFLSTLAEAYNLDNLQNQKMSLIDSSKNRLSGAHSQVYARGLVAAFLCDLAIIKHSKGSHSIDKVFSEIYRKYRLPNEPTNGSTAILSVLSNYSELALPVEKYIKETGKINWETELESLGIEAKAENLSIKLSVRTKLSGKQKDLLIELGYNNWRKSSVKAN